MAYRNNKTNDEQKMPGNIRQRGNAKRKEAAVSGNIYDVYRYDGKKTYSQHTEKGIQNSPGRYSRARKDKDSLLQGKAVRTYSSPTAERKEHEEENYILTGRNPIREALKANRDLEKLLVQKGELSGSGMEIVKTAKERKILIQVVEKSRMDEIAPRHQGLIAFASAFRYSTVEKILQNAEERGEDPFLILLDGITDPHNFGAIIRSAECTGVHGIIVPQHRSVGLTPAAVKASAGAVEYLPIARVSNLNQTIEELQRKNIWVYALTMNGTNYEEISFSGGTAVVIGSEGDGISRLTEEKCDVSVSLPMKGHLDSLNASVAAGIIMYSIMSSREKGKNG